MAGRLSAALWIAALSMLASPEMAAAQDVPADYQAVLATLAKKGDFKDGVLKVNVPRNDLRVTIATARAREHAGMRRVGRARAHLGASSCTARHQPALIGRRAAAGR